jgi:hypothetical protein
MINNAIISLNSFNEFVFVMETEFFFFSVRWELTLVHNLCERYSSTNANRVPILFDSKAPVVDEAVLNNIRIYQHFFA